MINLKEAGEAPYNAPKPPALPNAEMLAGMVSGAFSGKTYHKTWPDRAAKNLMVTQ